MIFTPPFSPLFFFLLGGQTQHASPHCEVLLSTGTERRRRKKVSFSACKKKRRRRRKDPLPSVLSALRDCCGGSSRSGGTLNPPTLFENPPTGVSRRIKPVAERRRKPGRGSKIWSGYTTEGKQHPSAGRDTEDFFS